MKLYYSKGACSLAVRIVINELGIESQYEAVDLKTKKTAQGEDYLKINPKGYVPFLVVGNNQVLSENIAIQQYLGDTYPAAGLIPALGDFSRYRVLEWLAYIGTELHKNFGPLFNPDVDPELKSSLFMPMLQKKLKFVNTCLENKKFLMGDRFTLPDAYLFVMLTWAERMVPGGIASYTQLSRYFAELKTRPSIQKSLKQEAS